jgi:hypothetical protein
LRYFINRSFVICTCPLVFSTKSINSWGLNMAEVKKFIQNFRTKVSREVNPFKTEKLHVAISKFIVVISVMPSGKFSQIRAEYFAHYKQRTSPLHHLSQRNIETDMGVSITLRWIWGN